MTLPGLHVATHFLRRYRESRLSRTTERGLTGQWHLLSGFTDEKARLSPQPAELKKLIPPPDRYWADPFIWRKEGSYYIFCEEVLYRQKRGRIAVIQMTGDGQVASSTPVIEEPYHLAYPFLFEFEGALYMMPDCGSAPGVEIYRCERFPDQWRKCHTAMRGIQAFDPTLFPHAGRWWMFASVKDKRRLLLPDHDLFLFSADSPFSDHWESHPCNPVLRSFRRARPAGKVFEWEGKLYRPSQDCHYRYGFGLNINEIVTLDRERYEERVVYEIKSGWEPGNVRTHHVDWHEGMLVMDAQRLRPAGEIIW